MTIILSQRQQKYHELSTSVRMAFIQASKKTSHNASRPGCEKSLHSRHLIYFIYAVAVLHGSRVGYSKSFRPLKSNH